MCVCYKVDIKTEYWFILHTNKLQYIQTGEILGDTNVELLYNGSLFTCKIVL